MRTDDSIDDRSNAERDAVNRLRSGMMVRVVNPRSPHYGNTGHLLGRNEHREEYWLVRFATAGTTIHLLDEEFVPVEPTRGHGSLLAGPDNLGPGPD